MLLGKRWREVGFNNLCLYFKKAPAEKHAENEKKKKCYLLVVSAIN